MNIQLPEHLQKYKSLQNYENYTPQDQAVWRYCLRQLKEFLSRNGHSCYLAGLDKTGITSESIPKISEMSQALQKFGWTAMPVSGFIPPAAFMELQSLGILPIACDMRTIDHILYTPAPDIVHEAAGHAPIIIDPEYADYLKQYSQVAKKSIISKEDIELYEAIRDLSDIKENPSSTENQIKYAEIKLQETLKKITHTSEASQLSRMNWWTAEYGLIGDLGQPKIFGAGLLSSIGESKFCLTEKVKKIPLSLDCIHQGYDITEPQPQLFVTPDFKTLVNVLNEFAQTMAYNTGGVSALEKAHKAESINTIEFENKIQISGQLETYLVDQEKIIFLKFSGPTQLAFKNQEISGHGKNYHSQGYSSPVGKFTIDNLVLNQQTTMSYESGFKINGILTQKNSVDQNAVIYSFNQVTMTYKNEIYFKPEWGILDIITGHNVISVFGGPADRLRFGSTDDFIATIVPPYSPTLEQKNIYNIFQIIRVYREGNNSNSVDLESLFEKAKKNASDEWLIFLELFELASKFNFSCKTSIKNYLDLLIIRHPQHQTVIEDGLQLIYA